MSDHDIYGIIIISMKRIVSRISTTLYLFLAPLLLFAQNPPGGPGGSNQVGTILDLIKRLAIIVNPLIALLSGFAILAFVRGIAVFIWSAENEEKRSEGKKFMIWGIVGMFVLFSFWGVVKIIQVFYFGVGVGTPFQPPF